MLQPVNLQLSHFNVEHSAQISKDAIAAAQQTAQGQEVVKESVKRAQIVEASIASAEPQKVKRRDEDERKRQGQQGKSFSSREDSAGEEPEAEVQPEVKINKKSGFDLYA